MGIGFKSCCMIPFEISKPNFANHSYNFIQLQSATNTHAAMHSFVHNLGRTRVNIFECIFTPNWKHNNQVVAIFCIDFWIGISNLLLKKENSHISTCALIEYFAARELTEST